METSMTDSNQSTPSPAPAKLPTLKDLVIAQKCRKGPSDGTTKRGAYWQCAEVQIRSYGGDGIGQSAASVKHVLLLRHFRSGEVRAVIHRDVYHQNGGEDTWHPANEILDCTTIEDVIVQLKSMNCGEAAAYNKWGENALYDALTELGMIESLPAPDEVAS